jgi:purine-binding chemotaxis protein CheW
MDLAKIRKKLHKKTKSSEEDTRDKNRQDKTPSVDTPVTESLEKREISIIKLFCFQVAAEYYALKMEDIQEVINYRDITPVPKTAIFMKGIISLRGKIVPVIDLKERLKIKDKDVAVLHQKRRIVIVKGPKGPIGITIDRIIEVSSFNAEDLKPPPPNMSEEEARFVTAVVIFKDAPFSVLNVDEVFSF